MKLFSDRYLNCGPDDDLLSVPEPLNDSDSVDEVGGIGEKENREECVQSRMFV